MSSDAGCFGHPLKIADEMYGPELRGSNFVLRPLREADADVMSGWFEDLEVTAGIKLRFVPSPEQEREFVRRHAADPNSVLWAIEHNERCIGTTGIHAIDWVSRRGTTGTLIGDKGAWGKGIGGELMKLRAAYAFNELGLNKLCSGYIEGNQASARAQASAGYVEVGRRRQHTWRGGRWLDHIETELLRSDWEKAQLS